jgi:hypothetical protein
MAKPDEPNPSPAPFPFFGENILPIYANQFHVSVIGGVVRVVFGEVILGAGEKFFPHLVITMTVDRATELSALIPRVIQAAAADAAEKAKNQPPVPGSV